MKELLICGLHDLMLLIDGYNADMIVNKVAYDENLLFYLHHRTIFVFAKILYENVLIIHW